MLDKKLDYLLNNIKIEGTNMLKILKSGTQTGDSKEFAFSDEDIYAIKVSSSK